jgi:hypothetical protein
MDYPLISHAKLSERRFHYDDILPRGHILQVAAKQHVIQYTQGIK